MIHEPTIIYEDNDILVLNKPSGMTVNKADTTKEEITIQDWIETKFKIQNSKFKIEENYINGEYNPNFEFMNRSGIVHRLDKETSGLLIIAKNVESFIHLQNQFKERIVKKNYIALVHGKIIPEEGEIAVPVGRLPFNRMRFGVVAGGREAVTRYKTISHFKKEEIFSLLELYPQTGRTHQIRVHVKYLNHPIVGDALYAGRKTARNDRKYLTRLFLHASKITFLHPKENKEVTFTSPLPEELQNFLDNLA